MHAWSVKDAAGLTRESLALVFAAAADIDVLLIGLGTDISRIDPALREELRAERIIVEAVATGGAVHTYNILLGEQRAVAAALIAVERAR